MQPESLPVDEPAHLARRLAQQLERSEAERADYRKLLDAMIRTAGVGVSLIDAERRFVRVNDMLSDLFGVSADALPGRPAIEILADELRAAGGDALERVFNYRRTRHRLLAYPHPRGQVPQRACASRTAAAPRRRAGAVRR